MALMLIFGTFVLTRSRLLLDRRSAMTFLSPGTCLTFTSTFASSMILTAVLKSFRTKSIALCELNRSTTFSESVNMTMRCAFLL